MIDINPSQSAEKPLNLTDFAQQNQITEDRVWELIEEGELAARFVNDEILILREQEVVPVAAEPTFIEALPEPTADIEVAPTPTLEAETETESDIETEPTTQPPLPNEDYHDLLLFAQDAMNRTMGLSHQLLATKDELLRMKDERIQYLAADLLKKEQEIRALKGRIEDLETLCRLNPL